MPAVAVNFLNAVLIVSEEPKRLAQWYRDVLGLPLADEQHSMLSFPDPDGNMVEVLQMKA
jgi:hypothetical protein